MKLFLIDVDNTLYPQTSGIFDLIDKRINSYMKKFLNMNEKTINQTRLYYWNKYGTTMSGLIKHHNIDPYHFLDYTHDIDVSKNIKQNQEVLLKLKQINAVKIAFTNAPKKHAQQILNALGIIDQFIDIFDIISADFIGKPNKYPYEKIINLTKAKSYFMADDWEKNLKTAKELGVYTILIGSKESDSADLVFEKFEDIPAEIFEKHSK
jgi:putative hydrolase of the HAD superfamily